MNYQEHPYIRAFIGVVFAALKHDDTVGKAIKKEAARKAFSTVQHVSMLPIEEQKAALLAMFGMLKGVIVEIEEEIKEAKGTDGQMDFELWLALLNKEIK